MAGYDCLPMKMKRKDIDRVNDEFSDFSLSAPARKIRRLDLDLPPIMEEEEIQTAPVNEERAIVLYKPLQHHQPSRRDLYVDRDLISGFNNRFLHNAAVADDLYDEDDKTNKHQAVVPWDPSQFRFTGNFQDPPEPEIVELDGEDAMMEEAAMDVEQGNSTSVSFLPQQHQWQQQLHCMIPQLPQTNSTPISWFR